MSQQKLNTTNESTKTQYKSLSDPNLLYLWLPSGSEWSSTIKEEIQATTNQPFEQEDTHPSNKLILFGVLTTLVLLGAATWFHAPKVYQAIQEVARNSVDQVILKDY